MSLNDYEFIDPEGTEVGDELEKLANRFPGRATRLVDWLESSVVNEAARDLCATTAGVECYLVPPRFVLSNLPDSAALMRIDHTAKKIEVVRIIQLYGADDEPAEWEAIANLAMEIAKG